MSAEIRAFRRGDGEQVTALVNAHVQAVMPGVSVPPNAVHAQLERDPSEFIVDPWVDDRRMLVAEERGRVVAAALLYRYSTDERVGEGYRGSGSIEWFVHWLDAPFWPDAGAGAAALMEGCIEQLSEWKVTAMHAGGGLPAPAVYGIPDCWPHIAELYERHGFVHEGRVEVIMVAKIPDIPRPGETPVAGLELRREFGINGTRFTALHDGHPIGLIEVESDLTRGGTRARFAGWADIGNLEVDEPFQRRGVGRWLLGEAASWLEIGRVDRLIAYGWPEEEAKLAFLRGCAFNELTRTRRGWSRPTMRGM
jgi:GNAT superfamily N-acetyltransferase